MNVGDAASVHADGSGSIAYVNGAPESVLVRSSHVLAEGTVKDLDRGLWFREAERMAGDGLRVLAVAEHRFSGPAPRDIDAVEEDLTLPGLVGLIDPPRPEASAAVATCRTAGIVPVMITGDHPATARTIARRLGVAAPEVAARGPAVCQPALHPSHGPLAGASLIHSLADMIKQSTHIADQA